MSQGNPVLKGTLIAICGLALAGLLGWGLMTIGANRLKAAEQEKEPLRQAMSFLAAEAITSVNEANLAIANRNWGEAQKPLRHVDDIVGAMGKAVTRDTQDRITAVQSALKEAQEAVQNQDKGAQGKLEDLTARLRALQTKGP